MKEKGVTAAVGDLAYVGNGVAIFGEFDGGVVDEERVGRLAGEFGVDDFPRAAERMGGRRCGGEKGFDHSQARLVISRAAVSTELGEARSLTPLAPSSANLRAPGRTVPSKEPTAVL